MSLLNLISIITLILVLAVGLTVRHLLKRHLRDIDGVVGLSKGEEDEVE